MPYEVVRSILKHQGKIVDVYSDEITLPDGRTAQREIVKRGRASAIVPVDSDGNVVLVRQYRHGAGKELLEIPAGMLDGDEDPLDCAVRELEEETGLRAGKIHRLTEYYASAGYCTEVLSIYLATELSKGRQSLDQDEFLEIERYGLEAVTAKIMSGEITDAKTIIGILVARERLSAL